MTLHAGDSREVLAAIPDNTFDSVVTDPPYALVSIQKRFGKPGSAPAQQGKDGLYARASAGFMGKEWDTGETAFDPAFWADVLRVAKPGAHLVAFGGTRTYHRLACAIEDAGWGIRDQLAWVYGSGFPKSHDVAKGIDKRLGAAGTYGAPKSVAHAGWIERGRMRAGEGHEGYQRPCMDDPAAVDRSARNYEPAAPEAAKWDGWGTALKPAWEPIVLARKPLVGSVAANVLAHGVGALNIDGCRVAADGETFGRQVSFGPDLHEGWSRPWQKDPEALAAFRERKQGAIAKAESIGRWPANLTHDGSPDVLAAFPDGGGHDSRQGLNGSRPGGFGNVGAPAGSSEPCGPLYADSGSAARFFYRAKADASDRLGFKHPTIKPVDLMQWLVRLVTPKGGMVLDLFAGTGTTGEAAWREGMNATLIEREPDYCADIGRRMEMVLESPRARRRAAAGSNAARTGAAEMPLAGTLFAALDGDAP